MSIFLSWELGVASILILTSLASSAELKLSDPLSDPTSSETREDQPDKPLPIKISSVKFESVCVNIYDSQTTKNNKKIYFFSPIPLLSHLNVVSIHDQSATQGILSVSFSIWNQEVRKKVAQHLTQVFSQQIEPSHVKVFPFDSVRLTSKVQPANFSLTNEWLPYGGQPSLRFTLICPTREHCDRVKTEMRINPEQFDHLRLELNPKLNDDSCFNDGVGISQEDLSIKVKELLANIEAKFAKELTASREETKKDFAATSQILADKIKVTEENLTATQKKLEATEATLISTRIELINMKSTVDDLTTKLNANSQRLGNELKVTEDNLRKELKVTSSHLETTTSNLALTRLELSSANAIIAELTTKLNARTKEIVDIGKMPTSCADLQRMGHKLSGFFSVKGSKKMETVYCDFNPNENDLQKWIGYADAKSAPVHFCVRRNSSYSKSAIVLPFDVALTNEGNAMNLTTGVFTAPRVGIYFFSFTGLAEFPASSSGVWLGVSLYLNGKQIVSTFVDDVKSGNQRRPLTLQSMFNLKKGDEVVVSIAAMSTGASLLDGGNHHTTFTGFMLEEDIVASLP